MKSLKEIIKEAEQKRIAVGHFNISEIVALKGIFSAAQKLNVPVIIGTSEGEAGFLGRYQTAALIKSLREQYNFPIFLNSDHTHSLEGVKEAVLAGYDAILFDGGNLDFEENIQKTREAVEYVRSINPEILVEGEIGYIGNSSTILKDIPEGAAIKVEDLTKPEDAFRFVKETGVDLLAPAVGNLHGMMIGGENPRLNIERIKEIKEAIKVLLVLHGGSGIDEKDFVAAIEAGISVIHINTEIRIGWRRGLERGFKNNPDEIVPYKILSEAVAEIEKIVYDRLQLFNKLH